MIGSECLSEGKRPLYKFILPTSPVESLCSCSMTLQQYQSAKCFSATCQVLIPSLSRVWLSVLSFYSSYSVGDVKFLLHLYLQLLCTSSSGAGQQGLWPVRGHTPCKRGVCSPSHYSCPPLIAHQGYNNSGQNVYPKRVFRAWFKEVKYFFVPSSTKAVSALCPKGINFKINVTDKAKP